MRVSNLGLVLLVACTGGGDGGGDAGASTSSSSSSSGTATSTTLSDTGFSKDCAVDDDCIPAFFGDACTSCAGSNATIAKSGSDAYQAAYNKAREGCSRSEAPGSCGRSTYEVTKCGATKKCELVSCGPTPNSDPHNCGDGGI